MKKNKINYPYLFKGKFLKDKRGYLDKFYDKKIFKKNNFRVIEVQISKYNKNVFRGIYMQTGKYGEAKFIKLLSGELIWFTIDLRKSSRTFGKIFPFKLSSRKILYTPRGFAHGSFSIKKSEVLIIADNNYDNKFSIGINYKDKNFFFTIKKFIKNKKITISRWHNSFGNFEEVKNKI